MYGCGLQWFASVTKITAVCVCAVDCIGMVGILVIPVRPPVDL